MSVTERDHRHHPKEIVLREDHDIVQLPELMPFSGLEGRNEVVRDPDFSTEIVRLTDATDNQGKSLQTASLAAAKLWNLDETMLAVSTTGGQYILYQFDPATMQSEQLEYRYAHPIAFSSLYNNILFVLEDTVVSRLKFKKAQGRWTFVEETEYCDFRNILPDGFTVKWTGIFRPSMDDSTIVVSFSEGAQNTGFLACCYEKGHGKGHGYRMLNTESGEITGDWGERGEARLVSTATQFPFKLHESQTCPNREYAMIGVDAKTGGDTPLLWTVPTLDLVDILTTGHSAHGMENSYYGGPGGGQMKEINYDDPSQTRLIVPPDELPAAYGQTYQGGRHYAFGLYAADDDSIFWASSQSEVYPFTSCWMNEVFGYYAMSGKVIRACHTFNSGLSSKFIVSHAIAIPSPQGHFVAFCSDMMQGLGAEGGGPESPTPGTARGDVFVVRVA